LEEIMNLLKDDSGEVVSGVVCAGGKRQERQDNCAVAKIKKAAGRIPCGI
jgi:hypothetical protein